MFAGWSTAERFRDMMNFERGAGVYDILFNASNLIGAYNDPDLGTCIDFDGAKGTQTEATTAQTVVLAAPLTLSAWVRPNFTNGTGNQAWAKIVCKPVNVTVSTDPYIYWSLGTDNSSPAKFVMQVSSGVAGSIITATGTTGITANQLYHVAGSYDGATVSIYVDGVLEGTTATTLVVGNSNNPTLFGSFCTFSTSSDTWKGVIADVRLYDIDVGPERIWQMYDPLSRWDLYRPEWQRRTFGGSTVVAAVSGPPFIQQQPLPQRTLNPLGTFSTDPSGYIAAAPVNLTWLQGGGYVNPKTVVHPSVRSDDGWYRALAPVDVSWLQSGGKTNPKTLVFPSERRDEGWLRNTRPVDISWVQPGGEYRSSKLIHSSAAVNVGWYLSVAPTVLPWLQSGGTKNPNPHFVESVGTQPTEYRDLAPVDLSWITASIASPRVAAWAGSQSGDPSWFLSTDVGADLSWLQSGGLRVPNIGGFPSSRSDEISLVPPVDLSWLQLGGVTASKVPIAPPTKVDVSYLTPPDDVVTLPWLQLGGEYLGSLAVARSVSTDSTSYVLPSGPSHLWWMQQAPVPPSRKVLNLSIRTTVVPLVIPDLSFISHSTPLVFVASIYPSFSHAVEWFITLDPLVGSGNFWLFNPSSTGYRRFPARSAWSDWIDPTMMPEAVLPYRSIRGGGPRGGTTPSGGGSDSTSTLRVAGNSRRAIRVTTTIIKKVD
jgi:hypothetical protein